MRHFDKKWSGVFVVVAGLAAPCAAQEGCAPGWTEGFGGGGGLDGAGQSLVVFDAAGCS